MINSMKNKVFIETYGCQMNEYDSELVKSILNKEGYSFVPNELEADIVMLNTCAIREHAHTKVFNRIHEIHSKRKKNAAVTRDTRHVTNTSNEQRATSNKPQPVLIGILGCMATNLRQELFENKKLKIDFIAGPDSYKRLPQLIAEAQATGKKQFDLTLSEFETYSDVFTAQSAGKSPLNSAKVNAWIAVSRGCNNFCTFCVVPYTRGRERSRDVLNVVEEVRHLTAEGFKQVTLLGQNVNSYFAEGQDFADLLEAVSTVPGIERVRFTSPHPKDFPDKLLDVVARNPKVCKHIHMPLQAGSNRVLELMNRTYTKEEFLQLATKARAKIPNVTLTTDIIVGFCSETDAEFEDTLTVMREVQFDAAFTFKYSERKGTIASNKYKDDVPEEVKTERIIRLVDLQRQISFKKNESHIGETQLVLVESPSQKTDTEWQGRNDGNVPVIFTNDKYKEGDFAQVRITAASPFALKGVSA